MDELVSIIILVIMVFSFWALQEYAPTWNNATEQGHIYILENGVICASINQKSMLFFVYETNFKDCSDGAEYFKVNNYLTKTLQDHYLQNEKVV